MSETLTLKVAETRQRDVGKSVIRIDPNAMNAIGIQTGNIVEIIATKKTAAIAWPAYAQDQGLGIVRIDAVIRNNASVNPGEDIIITRGTATVANSINLDPTNVDLRSDSRFVSFVKRKLLHLPVTLGDIIFISIGIDRNIKFLVTSAQPSETVVVEPESIIMINTKQEFKPKRFTKPLP